MSLEDGIIKPGEAMTFKTGLKVCMNEDECLYVLSRSSQGYKYNVCLMNSVGLIDSDFYNNPSNEGHFSVRLVNFGTDDFIVKRGDKIAQGVFSKYLTIDDEEDIEGERTGGLGSTGR
ncbi:MAG: dUTP diphosphatase [bacterium]|nr:dUTP diphosphatase [bacterium]